MHQVLRMLYIDQKSLTLDLLMTESFDSSITRKTIADLMFGVYDDSLYSDKIQLRESEKDIEIKKKQFEGIEQIFKATDNELNSNVINVLIEENNRQVISINEYLKLKEQQENKPPSENEEKDLKTVTLKAELLTTKRRLSLLQNQINEFEFELMDSHDFILSLEKEQFLYPILY